MIPVNISPAIRGWITEKALPFDPAFWERVLEKELRDVGQARTKLFKEVIDLSIAVAALAISLREQERNPTIGQVRLLDLAKLHLESALELYDAETFADGFLRVLNRNRKAFRKKTGSVLQEDSPPLWDLSDPIGNPASEVKKSMK